MIHTIILLPTTTSVGLNAVSQGLVRAIENQGVRVNFYKPITVHANPKIQKGSRISPMSIQQVEHMLQVGKTDELLNTIIKNHEKSTTHADIVVIEGINDIGAYSFSQHLNLAISRALSANVIFVTSPKSDSPESLAAQISSAAQGYPKNRVLGVIINKFNAPTDTPDQFSLRKAAQLKENNIDNFLDVMRQMELPSIIGTIPWQKSLLTPRVSDIAKLIHAKIINKGEMEKRRVTNISLCARNVENILDALQPDTLIITPADRSDIIIATALTALSGVHVAALLLTGNYTISDKTKKLCEQALTSGLPLIQINRDSFSAALLLNNLYFEIPEDDIERIEAVKEFIAHHIDSSWVKTLLADHIVREISPAAFRYKIIEMAKKANKTIVLPEGNEIRTLHAANICIERKIAKIILLGFSEEIERLVNNNGIQLHPSIQIIEPASCRKN